MKSRYLPLLAAALLTIGLLGAFDSATAAPINYYSISGAQAAASELNAIQKISNIGDYDIAAQQAIANTLLANHIQRSSIAELELSNPSLIAIAITQANLFEANLGDHQIDGSAITEIGA